MSSPSPRPVVGVLLSGCGFLDGSEIHEAVLTMLCLDRGGAEILCMAPAGAQRSVVDHQSHRPSPGETRDMLREAARIARGRIRDLATVRADELDAIVVPGGFGAAKNLCDFALVGDRAVAHPDVVRLLRELHAQRKPIGAACIAPALVATVFAGSAVNPRLTIGDDAGTAAALERLGARHEACAVDGIVVDDARRFVSTPAYMYDARIGDVARGIEQLVDTVLRWCGEDCAGPAPASREAAHSAGAAGASREAAHSVGAAGASREAARTAGSRDGGAS